MWQRFSSEARRAVFYAQEVAQKYGEGYVDVEFLFLGVIGEKDCEAVEILQHLSISSEDLTKRLTSSLALAEKHKSADMTLTPKAKRAIDLAYSESRDLNDQHIGTEHLLLGIAAEGSTKAARLLEELGASFSTLREMVARFREQGKTEGQPQSADAFKEGAQREKNRRENRIRVPDKYAFLLLVTRQNLSVPRLLLLTALADQDGAAAAAFAKAAGLNHKLLHYLLEKRMLNFQEPPSEVHIDAVLARASEIAAERAETLNSAHLFFAIFDLKADPYLQELIGDISLESLLQLLDEERS